MSGIGLLAGIAVFLVICLHTDQSPEVIFIITPVKYVLLETTSGQIQDAACTFGHRQVMLAQRNAAPCVFVVYR